MSKLGQYLDKADNRVKRRKSLWNLILVPLMIICVGSVYFLFWKLAANFQNSLIPNNVIFWSYTRIGSIFMFIPLFFPSIPLGLMFANFIAWCIAPARKAFNREAQGDKHVSFRNTTKYLFYCSMVLMWITFPVSFVGAHNYFYVNEKGVTYYSFLRKNQYDWNDISKVLIGCSTRLQKSRVELKLNYILTFQDGLKIDLWEDNPLKFLDVYNRIFSFLQSNHTIIYEERIMKQGIENINKSWSPAIRVKMKKVLYKERIEETGVTLH